jgi:hypothetical protein
LGGFRPDFAIFVTLISHSKHGRFWHRTSVHPKGKSMSQAMIDRRALRPSAAAGFCNQLRVAS